MSKRYSNNFIVALVTVLLLASSPLVYGAGVNYSAAEHGALTGQAKVNKVGALLFADAVAALTVTEVTITTHVHGKGPNHNTEQLHGKIGKTTVSGDNANGYALFQSGLSLNNLPSSGADPRVELKDGKVVKGNVSDLSSETVTIGGQVIDLSLVSAIHSPYVYEFTVPLVGDLPKITFSPTLGPGGGSHAPTKAKGPHGGVGTIIVVTVIGAVIATAIAVPIAIVAANRHHNNNNEQAELISFLSSRSQSNPFPMPVHFGPPINNTSTKHNHNHGGFSSDAKSALSQHTALARWQGLGQRLLASRVGRLSVNMATSPQVSTLSKHLVKTAPLLIKASRGR